MGKRFQKSHWSLSRLKWERAVTVETEPHPGWRGREDLRPVSSAYFVYKCNKIWKSTTNDAVITKNACQIE